MRPIIYFLIALPLVFLAATFSVKNSHIVTVSYYYGVEWLVPLSVLLFVVFVFGICVGYLASLKTVIRIQRQASAAKNEARQAEQEVSNLRSLPLKDAV
jgi:putative membrane protein